MTILTENNAFQNIGKCFNAECESKIQVYDFLQFCIEFIFYDKTHIVGTVPPNVIHDTSEVIDKIKNKYHIDIFDFHYIKDDSEEAKTLIDSIADQVLFNIDDFFYTSKHFPDKEMMLNFPVLGDKSKELIEAATIAIKNNKKYYTDEYFKLSSFKRDSCYFKILNANKCEIIDKIFEFDSRNGWNNIMTLSLLTKIRFLTNRTMAKINHKIFMPSVKRGKNDFLYGLVTNDLKSNVYENPIGFIKMPSVKKYIIEKGKGNPYNIMETAVELREKLNPIREYIDKNKINLFEDKNTLENIEKTLFEKINKKYKKANKKVAGNIITIDYEQVNKNDPDLLLKYNKLEKCVQAFTEITTNNESDISEYEKDLIKNCMKG